VNLKDEYNKAFVEDLANLISTKASSFSKESFFNSVINKEWEEKELKERISCITSAIKKHLDYPYNQQVDILTQIAPSFKGLQNFMFPNFIEKYGLNDLKTSFEAMEYLTQLSTAEFAIRPFIEKYQNESMSQMFTWSNSKNHHIRRLSSEGSRPRLPWASTLKRFIIDPTPSLLILENLKNDNSEYVRKSVANHLNDISKDHPELILKIGNNWYGNSPETNWIVKHGLRTLLKKGNKKALAIFGFDDSKNLIIQNLALSTPSIEIGEFIHFEFDLTNRSKLQRNIRVEYRIDYVKANGSYSGKIFQISEFILKPESNRHFKRKQWFKELTTRKHYPGNHKITLIVNGDEKETICLTLNINH